MRRREDIAGLGFAAHGVLIGLDRPSLDRRYINRIRGLAQELVGLQPDIIVTDTTPPIVALQRETRTIPIVCCLRRGNHEQETALGVDRG
jgi:hypothetical protein